MALIKCPECGKEISSEAKVCPHCGSPVKRRIKKPWYKIWWAWLIIGLSVYLIAMVIILFVNINRGADLARETDLHKQMEEISSRSEQISSDTSTSKTEPPFFNEECQIDDNNSMSVMAGHTDSGILVSVFCQIDGSNENLSSALYVTTYANCIILSKKASVFLIVTDTASGETSYRTISDDSSSGEDPKFYNLEADIYDTNPEDWYNEVDDLFQNLEAAIDDNE